MRAQQREGTRGLGWRSGAVVRGSSNSPVRQIRIAREHANPTSPVHAPKSEFGDIGETVSALYL
jgi:hypothetical protein